MADSAGYLGDWSEWHDLRLRPLSIDIAEQILFEPAQCVRELGTFIKAQSRWAAVGQAMHAVVPLLSTLALRIVGSAMAFNQ